MTVDKDPCELSEEDQKSVDEFLHSGLNKTSRASFRPWKLGLALVVIVVVLGIAARVIGTLFLPY